MRERAVLTNRPSLDLSPFVLEGHKSLTGSVGQIRCLPQPEQLHGLGARTEQGREWMMAQNDLAVVGIDVAKDKVDLSFEHWRCGRPVRTPPKVAANWWPGFAGTR